MRLHVPTGSVLRLKSRIIDFDRGIMSRLSLNLPYQVILNGSECQQLSTLLVGIIVASNLKDTLQGKDKFKFGVVLHDRIN